MEAKFKVGDRVRVTTTHGDHRSEYVGCEFTIHKVYDVDHAWYNNFKKWGRAYGIGRCHVVFESELELVESAPFTKKDLKTGDVVLKRDGAVEIVCLETNSFILQSGNWNDLNDIADDLTYKGPFSSNNNSHDIIAVRRPEHGSDCTFKAFDRKYGKLVYERKEVEEMTLEEVCKALGKEIKIVTTNKPEDLLY